MKKIMYPARSSHLGLGTTPVFQMLYLAKCYVCKVQKRVDQTSPTTRCPYCKSLMDVRKLKIPMNMEQVMQDREDEVKKKRRRRWLKNVWADRM